MPHATQFAWGIFCLKNSRNFYATQKPVQTGGAFSAVLQLIFSQGKTMPSVSDVRPKIWSDVLDLYDDGKFSAIWGCREKSAYRELGVRWNGEDGYVGYPNQGRNPVWFSEPDFLHRPILLSLLKKVASSQHLLAIKNHLTSNILTALEECDEAA